MFIDLFYCLNGGGVYVPPSHLSTAPRPRTVRAAHCDRRVPPLGLGHDARPPDPGLGPRRRRSTPYAREAPQESRLFVWRSACLSASMMIILLRLESSLHMGYVQPQATFADLDLLPCPLSLWEREL